jgi:SOS-response transcriptional repressor LexA
MRDELTDRQLEVFQMFCKYLEAHRVSPTMIEFGHYLSLTKQGAHHSLKVLERKGYLSRGGPYTVRTWSLSTRGKNLHASITSSF